MKKIKLELVEQENLEDGISYSIKLINNSDYVIKQNNVYVSFPIKQDERFYKGNDYKVEADGNKLDIQPGENITLRVFMPFRGIVDKTLVETDNPNIQLMGYLQTVDKKNYFTVGGALNNKI